METNCEHSKTNSLETIRLPFWRNVAEHARFFLIGIHEQRETIDRRVAEDPHYLDPSPIAVITMDQNGVERTFGHQGEELNPYTQEPLNQSSSRSALAE